MPVSRCGNFGEIDFDAGAAARSHFAGGAGETGCAHILNGDDGAGVHGFEAGFEKKFFDEGIADLHVGALLLRLFGEFGGGEQRGAVNAVASGFCADVDHRIAGAFGFGEEDVFTAGDAEGQRIDEGILRVAGFEDDFAADGGNAEAIAVVGDAADHAIEDAAILAAESGSVVLFPGMISPKRRESRIAMGRAPMVKMSRRMPPTPVVAP